MKKYILLSALSLAMLGWSACQDENEAALNVAPNGKSLTFSANVSGGNSLSKTAVSANGKSIVFAEGESMMVYPNVGDSFIISNSADNVNSFSGVAGDEASSNATNFVAMYPSGGRDNGDLVMFIPEAQKVVSGSFDPEANLLIAETSSKDMTLRMHNVCSYIKVNIDAEATCIKVCADQPLAGKVSVSADGTSEMVKGESVLTLEGNITPGSYYIAVMPGQVTNLMIYTDNDDIKPIEVAEFEFVRGQIHNVGMGEEKLLSPADIVDYVNASKEEIVTLNMALETYDVAAIKEELLKIENKAVKLVIPEGVTEIGESAFSGVFCILTVVIPESVTSIGMSAFAGSGITSIAIPNGIRELEKAMFERCVYLTSVSLPDGLEKIGPTVFSYCLGLKNIDIPNSVREISVSAFGNCDVSFTTPENAFWISIPNYLESFLKRCPDDVVKLKMNSEFNSFSEYYFDLENNALKNTSKKVHLVLEPIENYIGENYFKDCQSITSVEIPGEVTFVGSSSFMGCSNLETVVMGEGVSTIFPNAFDGCSKLESISLPESLFELYEGVFDNCPNLKTIYCSPAIYVKYHETYPQMVVNPEFVKSEFDDSEFYKEIVATLNSAVGDEVTLNVPLAGYDQKQLLSALQNTIKKVNLVFPEGISGIDDSKFQNCSCIVSVTISDSDTRISESAFFGCPNLQSVSFPNGIKQIDKFAFKDCPKLSSVDFGQGQNTKIIAYNAFENSVISNLEIPSSVENWGDYTFENGHLISISIPQGVEEIGDWEMAGFEHLLEANLSEGLVSIGSGAFFNVGLASITLPNSLETIGEYAFDFCNSLQTIYCSQAIYDKYHATYPQMVVKE